MSTHSTITKAEQRILGFLLAAGGDHNTGSTIRDIQEGTGLSHNTVYLAIRKDMPGIMRCINHTSTGAAMYYVTAESIKRSVQPILTAAKQSIFDSEEWSEVPPVVFGALSNAAKGKPASPDSIAQLIQDIHALNPDSENYYYGLAIIGQAIAIHALQLAKA